VQQRAKIFCHSCDVAAAETPLQPQAVVDQQVSWLLTILSIRHEPPELLLLAAAAKLLLLPSLLGCCRLVTHPLESSSVLAAFRC
jgi:hypothetical protein